MVVFQSCLFAFIHYLRVSSASDNRWNAEIPKSIVGLSGSCVVIPCKFNYPSDGRKHRDFTGIWFKDKDIIYHKETSKVISTFKGRTSIGDLRHNNCTLKISSLQHSDSGSYKFRIEIKDFNKNTFLKNPVSITVKDSPDLPTISVDKEVTSQKEVTATCAVSHSCPPDPPRLTWSHKGTTKSPSQAQEDGQWKLTSSLTFTPSREDHNKPLNCSAEFTPAKTVSNNKKLKVKYPPYNVNVQSKSQVKENESVELNCSGESYPPIHSFQWFGSTGSLLENRSTYRFNHVTRYTEAITCTATNTEGKNCSAPHKFNVLYPPEIKSGSSCESETFIVCVCIVDSNPPSEVKWLGPSSTFPSSGVEQNGSLTIFTLQGWRGFPDTVHCSASNSEGNSVMTLSVPHHGLFIYLAVASAAVVVILAVISACLAKRRCARRVKQQNDQNKMKTIQKSCSDRGKQKSNDIYTSYQDNTNYEYEEICLPSMSDEDEVFYANT
ncbi:myelin-associated glycoprotein-like isoform X1 [Triplophysa dalaica]|uniref:myelin-associated glycoprotein-like isoform X1 n=1 Tax=Triplophysa dalaica TaxID=1582913 RepID=UPI0024DF6BD6|nr:myelin-associated glycoprotein-like isoform X1 [Triplophysa dalaica]